MAFETILYEEDGPVGTPAARCSPSALPPGLRQESCRRLLRSGEISGRRRDTGTDRDGGGILL